MLLENSSDFGLIKKDIEKSCIDSYLRGLQLGDALSRDRVMCLLKIISTSEEYANKMSEKLVYFTSRIRQVPAWMFLQYSAQVISAVDSSIGKFAIAILEHIASHYPLAIYYPFCVSYPGFRESTKANLEKLNMMLRDDTLSKFVESLSGLTHPQLRWIDGLKDIITLLKARQTNAATERATELAQCCLSTSWPEIGSKIGTYNSKFAREMKAGCAKHLSGVPVLKDIESLLELARSSASTRGHIMNMKFSTGKVPLNEFSEWLAELGNVGMEHNMIEIPGQYISNMHKEPNVHEHAKLLSVLPELLVMSSIRKPKRISFLGTTGKIYNFLVKGGEDLRNDERIEQLFSLMNSIIVSKASSKTSFRHSLSVRTFGVVPMTPRLGVLEWVSNTIPLRSIICEEMAKDQEFLNANPAARSVGGGVDLSSLLSSEERSKWLKGASDPQAYHDMFKKARIDSAQKLWRKMSRYIPDDFLRRRFLKTSSSAESFVLMRDTFSRSLATNSIFGYILGIGDRHLDNLLIDMQGGNIVQIDFGVCFGIGASVLPVPELLPFRLTSQLRGLFQPLDGTMLLRHFMIQAISAIRVEEARSAICNALEVYLNDPVVDWIKDVDISEVDKSDIKWEPRRRIVNAMKKLEGYNPASVLIDDLSTNGFVKKFNSLESLSKGIWLSAVTDTGFVGNESGTITDIETTKDTRVMSWRDGKISAEAQVDILINMATDPNLLVRHWVGLFTWI
jgi:DNA-dependent protein kinase catalytic subunit